jgi:hypothetical protein
MKPIGGGTRETLKCAQCNTLYTMAAFCDKILKPQYEKQFYAVLERIHRHKLAHLRAVIFELGLMDEYSYIEHCFDRAGL